MCSSDLGEKRDVKVWLAWLERYAHGEMDYVVTPMGNLPLYEDLEILFSILIDKEYSEELYKRQFTLDVDKIVARIDLQVEAYSKEKNIPEKFFKILAEQRQGLLAMN